MSSDRAAKRLELLTQTLARTAVTLQPLAGRHPDDLERLFETAARERADALIVFAHGFAVLNRGRITELAAGSGLRRSHHEATKLADLPIEQPTKFELVLDSAASESARPHDPAAAAGR